MNGINFMKKVKNNKIYDTQTAQAIGTWSNNESNDFKFVKETLYRKRTGEFFLYGIIGGPKTWLNGESIHPLSYDEAKKWAEEKLPTEIFNRLFNITKDENCYIGINISKRMVSEVDKFARNKKINRSEMIREIIKDWLLKNGENVK